MEAEQIDKYLRNAQRLIILAVIFLGISLSGQCGLIVLKLRQPNDAPPVKQVEPNEPEVQEAPVKITNVEPVNNRREVFQRVVQGYIKTGEQEYAKGYYREAEQTFLMAQKFSKYLNRDDRVELNQLLVKALQKQRATTQ